MTLGPLSDGGAVVVIGGGPAGIGCALAVQKLAAATQRRIWVTVLEGKHFAGEQHYNQCCGVLSPPLPQLLTNRLDVAFPYHLSRVKILDYVLHYGGHSLLLTGSGEPSVALRRVQFDAYMLEQACQRGIRVQNSRAVELEFHANRVVVYTESDSLEADVVVGAFGMDEGSAALFSRQTGYQPPQALSSVVTKYHPGEAGMARIGERIHVFLPRDPRIEFAAVTPKGNHLTVNIAGRHVDADLMDAFLMQADMQHVLPNLKEATRENPEDFRFFKGRFPCSQAQRYYGDRYVMVGDAAGLVRAFKGKGVTSAVLTGIRAAETILQAGLSRKAFQEHYRATNQDILRDLPYGRVMRRLTIAMTRWGVFTPVVRAAEQNPLLRQALFEAVSAHAPYVDVFRRIAKPTVLIAVLREMVLPSR
jgi:flavin-dependent dehydrogenase